METTDAPHDEDRLSVIDFDRQVVDLPAEAPKRLRRLNLVAGTLHLVTGALMIILGNLDFTLPVTGFNIGGPPGTDIGQGTLTEVYGFPLAIGVASFALLSALFHYLISTVGFGRYINELSRGRNRFRWVEYSLSSTLMIVLIALTTGITDLGAVLAIAFANISMILFGWIMEMVNSPDRKTWWTPFWFGCIAGIGPWVAVVGSLIANISQEGAEGPPGFVYGIIVSIFVFFNCFAINQWLQYRQIGRWRDYLFGERIYIILSLVAKTALAWQIFANTLIE